MMEAEYTVKRPKNLPKKIRDILTEGPAYDLRMKKGRLVPTCCWVIIENPDKLCTREHKHLLFLEFEFKYGPLFARTAKVIIDSNNIKVSVSELGADAGREVVINDSNLDRNPKKKESFIKTILRVLFD